MLFTDFLYLCVRFMFIDGMLDFIHKYETKIEFSKIGHDLSLDFVKGVCILLVILRFVVFPMGVSSRPSIPVDTGLSFL